jgi:hypothetical protein
VKRKAISDDKAWEKAILVEERQMEKMSPKINVPFIFYVLLE